MYSLYLYFRGLSLRNTLTHYIYSMMRNEVILLYRIGFKGYGSCNIYKRKRIPAFIIDETFIQIGNQKYWL